MSKKVGLSAAFALALVLLISYNFQSERLNVGASLKVGIAPFQDMAMLVNIEQLDLEQKYDTDIELVTMSWPELTPAVASASEGVDVAFASMLQYITQSQNLNSDTQDPIVFFYPAYVFKGGAFVSFNESVPVITDENIGNNDLVEEFLSFKIAAQKTSSFELMLFQLSERSGVPLEELDFVDMGSEDGLLAAINGAVDVTSAGLTQKNEALVQGGRVVLEMTDLGQVDIAGFIAKQSTIDTKRDQIESLIKMWFETTDFVFQNPSVNAEESLAYLASQASTDYTFEQYMDSLAQEILPKSVKEMNQLVIEESSDFFYRDILDPAVAFYKERGIIDGRGIEVRFIKIE